MFQRYLEFRRVSGEKLGAGSPCIVTKDGSRRCSSDAIKNAIYDLLWKTGLRVEKKISLMVKVKNRTRNALPKENVSWHLMKLES